mmetsp:Transcript_7328/g.21613  ORF Transcript_7328/g.21613 Transcript_7328/m.21613 type:complete len:231 (-) Transcript_7328:922-1614(-)
MEGLGCTCCRHPRPLGGGGGPGGGRGGNHGAAGGSLRRLRRRRARTRRCRRPPSEGDKIIVGCELLQRGRAAGRRRVGESIQGACFCRRRRRPRRISQSMPLRIRFPRHIHVAAYVSVVPRHIADVSVGLLTALLRPHVCGVFTKTLLPALPLPLQLLLLLLLPLGHWFGQRGLGGRGGGGGEAGARPQLQRPLLVRRRLLTRRSVLWYRRGSLYTGPLLLLHTVMLLPL